MKKNTRLLAVLLALTILALSLTGLLVQQQVRR